MITIRASQMKAFEAARLLVFRERLAHYLAERYAVAGMQAADALAGRAIDEGETCGIVTERGIADLAALMAEDGADFSHRPLARQVLDDPQLPECAKIAMLVATRPWLAAPSDELLDEANT